MASRFVDEFANTVTVARGLECAFDKVGFEMKEGMVGIGCKHAAS